MKIRSLYPDVERELEEERNEVIKRDLTIKLREIKSMKVVLSKAEKQLQELLDKDVNDVFI